MNFWKMQGLGNDYIVIDNRTIRMNSAEAAGLARKLCERRYSVGADGLLLVETSELADVKMRIYNVDGSEAEMCGNGIRCFAKYCFENKIVNKKEMTVETLAGTKKIWLTVKRKTVNSVKVDMGAPALERNKIPMIGAGNCINQDLQVNSEKYKATCLSMGNPHCVIFVDDLDNFPVQTLGAKIEKHSLFPKRTNVEFAHVLNKNETRVRVWERGCGETLACGTGACATVVAGNLLGKTGSKVRVHLPGGDFDVQYTEHLFLSGPVESVYEGKMFEDVKSV